MRIDTGAGDGRAAVVRLIVGVQNELLVTVARPAAERSSLQADRHVEERVADLLVGHVQVLIGDEAEELVLDDGAADRAAQRCSDAVAELCCRPECRRPG